jgi:hypothetical protein
VEPAFEVADAGEVLVEPIAVSGAKVFLEPFGAVVDKVSTLLPFWRSCRRALTSFGNPLAILSTRSMKTADWGQYVCEAKK